MILTKKTAKLMCARAGIARLELTVEAQKLFDLYNDPNVCVEQKEVAKRELDSMIRELEEKVATRQMRKVPSDGGPSPLPAV
jgi:hypothetical protein